MNYRDLVISEPELDKLADLLIKDIGKTKENVVSRYARNVFDNVEYLGGVPSVHLYSLSNVNKEFMQSGIYNQTAVDNLLPHNIEEIGVARDRSESRFNFEPKNIPLPTEESFFFEKLPDGIESFDEELRDYSKQHKNTRVGRALTVEQKTVVNSMGGKAIQTIPSFSISFSYGYNPIPVRRNITLVCNSELDIKNMVKAIKYIPDPNPDKRIKKSKTFSEAFQELTNVSHLKYGSLEDAGISENDLYDVVMATGVSTHEIFGHHFEEPIRMLNVGEESPFKFRKSVRNKDIVFRDDPTQTVEGLKVRGFTHIDAYGRKREPRTHIENGKIKEFLGSEYVDSKKLKGYLGLEKSTFVGSASQSVLGDFPQPRMSCTFIDGPTESIDWEGKIVVVPDSGETDDRHVSYVVKSNENYVIRDGEPKRVGPLKISGGIKQAFANLQLINDSSYQCGTCGKLNPVYDPIYNRDVILEAGAPVSQFTKSQLWKEQQVSTLPISEPHLRILVK